MKKAAHGETNKIGFPWIFGGQFFFSRFLFLHTRIKWSNTNGLGFYFVFRRNGRMYDGRQAAEWRMAKWWILCRPFVIRFYWYAHISNTVKCNILSMRACVLCMVSGHPATWWLPTRALFMALNITWLICMKKYDFFFIYLFIGWRGVYFVRKFYHFSPQWMGVCTMRISYGTFLCARSGEFMKIVTHT